MFFAVALLPHPIVNLYILKKKEKRRTSNTRGFFKLPTYLLTRPPTSRTNEEVKRSRRHCSISRGITTTAFWGRIGRLDR